MESSLIFTLMLAFCGIISISSKKLTDKELRKIYDSTVDLNEFVDNVFTLPAPQQLYVYEYLQDLIENLGKDSKMTKFLNASLKLLQQKVDDFNEAKKLKKVSVREFIQKRINALLQVPNKKPVSAKATNKPSPSSEGNKSETGLKKNNSQLKTDDPKSKPMISEEKPLLNDASNPQIVYLMNAGTLSFSRNSPTNIDKKDPADEKSTLQKSKHESSESTKKPSPSKKNIASGTPSSTPPANDKKTPLSPNSLQMSKKIQPSMSTNPLNFILTFDKASPNDLKKPPLKPESELLKPVDPSIQIKENSSKQPSLSKKQISKNSLPSTNGIKTSQKIQTSLQATPASSKNSSAPKPKSASSEVKQPKQVENAIPVNKSKTTAQSQGKKSSSVKCPESSGAKSLKASKSSHKNQNASPAAATEGMQSFSV